MSRISGYYNINELSVITGLSKYRIYWLLEQGRMPAPIQRRCGFRGMVWDADEIDEWLWRRRQKYHSKN